MVPVSVKVTVLGTSGAWPSRGRACSGYLIETAQAKVVLDLGFGTLPRLLALCQAQEVSAVFISHAHADHCVDLYGLYRALRLPSPPFRSPPIFAAPEVMNRVGALDGDGGADRLRQGLDFHQVGPDESLSVGDLRLRTFALPHFTPNLGVRLESDESVIAYTGDTGPAESVSDLARGADLFICEATYQKPPKEEGPRFLLTATEAGQYAREAKAKRLMLTHFWPEDDRMVSRDLAVAQFAGELILAEEGLALTLE